MRVLSRYMIHNLISSSMRGRDADKSFQFSNHLLISASKRKLSNGRVVMKCGYYQWRHNDVVLCCFVDRKWQIPHHWQRLTEDQHWTGPRDNESVLSGDWCLRSRVTKKVRIWTVFNLPKWSLLLGFALWIIVKYSKIPFIRHRSLFVTPAYSYLFTPPLLPDVTRQTDSIHIWDSVEIAEGRISSSTSCKKEDAGSIISVNHNHRTD